MSLVQKVCTYLGKCKDFWSIKNEVVLNMHFCTQENSFVDNWFFCDSLHGDKLLKWGCFGGCGLTSNLSSSVLRSL